MERNYYWIRYGNEWYIAIKDYDDEQDKTCWYLDGMEMINEPDEVGEIVRRKESQVENGNCIKPAVNARFNSKEELRTFIQMHLPMLIRPTKPAKTMFISAFTSANAERIVIDSLTEALLNGR